MNVLERDYYTIEAIELMPEAPQRDLAKYTVIRLGKSPYRVLGNNESSAMYALRPTVSKCLK